MNLIYGNLQSPGPAINLTISEVNSFKTNNEKNIVTSAKHKTSLTYGPAVMALEELAKEAFFFYINNIRKNIPTSSSVDNALVTSNGQPMSHYWDHIKSITGKYGFKDFPTLTDIRKCGATSALIHQNEQELEKISEHISCSKATSSRYYRMRSRMQSAVSAHTTIQTITSKLTHFSSQFISSFLGNASDKDKLTATKGFSDVEPKLIKDHFKENISHCRNFMQKYKLSKKLKQIQDKVKNIIMFN